MARRGRRHPVILTAQCLAHRNMRAKTTRRYRGVETILELSDWTAGHGASLLEAQLLALIPNAQTAGRLCLATSYNVSLNTKSEIVSIVMEVVGNR